MFIKKINPTTPGQRWLKLVKDTSLSPNKPERSLVFGFTKSGGRNNQGKRTVKCRGGGHKKRYRLIDIWRTKHNIPAYVKSIEYDPMRTARIALVFYADGCKSYIIAPDSLKVGDMVMSGADISPEVGNALPLANIPVGTTIHNIELIPGKGAALVRSAGVSAQLLSKIERYVTIKLPSGERRLVLDTCMATVGRVSNILHNEQTMGKAGRNVWKGRRPRVRGVAMNPVDHPMGGGEGKASGGHPRSRKGLKAKGLRTRNKNKYSKDKILSRRSK